ncbi:MAG: phosphoribosylpyrophosphate synthetase [Flavobacteriales bacterium]|nr:phosphoribosylpyrophosphate synthetase [Flavobacteriales bacterium]
MKRTYDTLSSAVNDLQVRGYTDDLILQDECLVCSGKNTSLHPDEFQIDEFHRFEGESDPGDSSIVYAVSSEKHAIKGILVSAFGAEASRLTQSMVAKLATHPAQHT